MTHQTEASRGTKTWHVGARAIRPPKILTEHASQIASGEEDRPGTIAALYRRLLAKVRRNSVHDYVRADQACAGLFEAIDSAETGAEIAVAQMPVCLGALPRLLNGCQELVSWEVVIEKELRGDRSVPDLGQREEGVSSRVRTR